MNNNEEIQEIQEAPSFILNGTESIQTFGGESYYDKYFPIKEYGIDFQAVSVSNLSPEQFANLACQMINHLIVNGHSFAIQPNNHPDQPFIITRQLIHRNNI